MTNHITILYAFRNRDAQRVKLSLQSLQQQTALGFEVLFVDYGTKEKTQKQIKKNQQNKTRKHKYNQNKTKQNINTE
jgi:glycosyltransferase involved in cell wall biosynthesis